MFLIMFIFGVMGVQLFGRIDVVGNPGLTHNANFSNLYYALVLLYTISTTETWPDVMEGCQVRSMRPQLRQPLESLGPGLVSTYTLMGRSHIAPIRPY